MLILSELLKKYYICIQAITYKLITQKLNIDMAKIIGAVEINAERCKGCDLCVVACPTDVLSLQPKEVNNRGYHYAYTQYPEKCIGCSSCAMVCPDGCIEVYRVVEK